MSDVETIAEYQRMPYRVVLTPDHDDEGNAGWVAEIEELPGCLSQGATPEDAVSRLFGAMGDWLEAALERDLPIPLPREQVEREFSGRFVLRIPSSLHAELAVAAKREGVSLNQFAATLLAGAVGFRQAVAPYRESPGAFRPTTSHRG